MEKEKFSRGDLVSYRDDNNDLYMFEVGSVGYDYVHPIRGRVVVNRYGSRKNPMFANSWESIKYEVSFKKALIQFPVIEVYRDIYSKLITV